MPAFKDANGREWLVALDAPTIADVRQELKFDLAPPDGDPFKGLMADVVLRVNVLYVICREQCQKLNVTDREFGRALNGDAIASATEALVEAIGLFSHPRKRGQIKRMLELQQEAETAAVDLAMERMGSPELKQKLLAAAKDRMDAEIERALTGLRSVGDMPAS